MKYFAKLNLQTTDRVRLYYKIMQETGEFWYIPQGQIKYVLSAIPWLLCILSDHENLQVTHHFMRYT